jgi:hypothetical protein
MKVCLVDQIDVSERKKNLNILSVDEGLTSKEVQRCKVVHIRDNHVNIFGILSLIT